MNKADIGITTVAADLAKQGFIVCTPLSEHAPFDLVAVTTNNKPITIQVKFRAKRNGCVKLDLKNFWNNGKGTQTRAHKPVDYYAITEGSGVAYIDYEAVQKLSSKFTLRIDPPKNNQRKHIRLFEDYKKLIVC